MNTLLFFVESYGNHRDLAVAIRRSGVPRHQLWLTSKVKTVRGNLSRGDTLREAARVADELGVRHVDLLLLHHAKGNSARAQVDQWRGLIDAQEQGLAHNIGVSNYDVAQLERLHAATGRLPAVNQLELHPWVVAQPLEIARW